MTSPPATLSFFLADRSRKSPFFLLRKEVAHYCITKASISPLPILPLLIVSFLPSQESPALVLLQFTPIPLHMFYDSRSMFLNSFSFASLRVSPAVRIRLKFSLSFPQPREYLVSNLQTGMFVQQITTVSGCVHGAPSPTSSMAYSVPT